MKSIPELSAILLLLTITIGANVVLSNIEIDISPDFIAASSNQQTNENGSSDIESIVAVSTETVARPLFHPSRRPQALQTRQGDVVVVEEIAPLEENVTPVSAPPGITVRGIRRIGSTFAALIQDEADGTSRWVHPGDPVGSWLVQTVDANKLAIASNGNTQDHFLYQPITDEIP